MAGNLGHFVERMRYWCDVANLGYDQAGRMDIRVGGECDCSSLLIYCLKEAGFEVGDAWSTRDIRANLVCRGWKAVAVDGRPRAGDILIAGGHHVAVCTGSGLISEAVIGETGCITGNASGDQTGSETRTRAYYDYPWDSYLRYVGDGGAGGGTGSGAGGGSADVDVDALARAVIRGEYGYGAERRAALGDAYDAVQARVNAILSGEVDDDGGDGGDGGSASSPTVDELARAVIRGEYGVGAERRAALGDAYDAVQARVNELLG